MTSSLEELVSPLVVPLRNTMIVSLIPVLILEVLILIVLVLILIEPWCNRANWSTPTIQRWLAQFLHSPEVGNWWITVSFSGHFEIVLESRINMRSSSDSLNLDNDALIAATCLANRNREKCHVGLGAQGHMGYWVRDWYCSGRLRCTGLSCGEGKYFGEKSCCQLVRLG
nr:hypothetical protein [Tanacetum cinerariifolium]